jgi:hypothetical protein
MLKNWLKCHLKKIQIHLQVLLLLKSKHYTWYGTCYYDCTQLYLKFWPCATNVEKVLWLTINLME